MRIIATVISILALAACANLSRPSAGGIERSQSLGHGFWIITIAENIQGGFEAIKHSGYCYYRSYNVGLCNRMSPSPSGTFAIYQQTDTGLVMLYDTRSSQSLQLTESFPGLLGPATWQEQRRIVQFNAGGRGSVQSYTFDFSGVDGGT